MSRCISVAALLHYSSVAQTYIADGYAVLHDSANGASYGSWLLLSDLNNCFENSKRPAIFSSLKICRNSRGYASFLVNLMERGLGWLLASAVLCFGSERKLTTVPAIKVLFQVQRVPGSQSCLPHLCNNVCG